MMMNEMMGDRMRSMQGMDMDMMQRCMETLTAAEQACVMCADGDAEAGMAMCASMCMNCADVSSAMMRMMLRPSGFEMQSMMAMMQATMTMMTACAEECEKHADMHEHCKLCAQACRTAAEAMDDMMASMRAAMSMG
ncbi:hypothetical protein CLV46_0139 [Diaminobutyricimonas aerilata]|uniref:Uncharacterized protein n=2 Tax=Diaminobutyricimonas aerilata TaxID=1162967 RepID=A0A2M9CFG6_9MICO|nr:hypothetical protein CLV46_0139 [Diaminobutyricimonas aerilata]